MEINILVWIILYGVVFVLFTLLWRLSFDWKLKGKPQPPLIGWTLPYLGVGLNIFLYGPKMLLDLSKKGNIFRLYIAGRVFYFINDAEFFIKFYKSTDKDMNFYDSLKIFGLDEIVDPVSLVSVDDGNTTLAAVKKEFIPSLKSYLPLIQTVLNDHFVEMGNEGRLENFARTVTRLNIGTASLVFNGERIYKNTQVQDLLIRLENISRTCVTAFNKEPIIKEIKDIRKKNLVK